MPAAPTSAPLRPDPFRDDSLRDDPGSAVTDSAVADSDHPTRPMSTNPSTPDPQPTDARPTTATEIAARRGEDPWAAGGSDPSTATARAPRQFEPGRRERLRNLVDEENAYSG